VEDRLLGCRRRRADPVHVVRRLHVRQQALLRRLHGAGIFVSRWIARIKADKHPAFAIHWLYWHLPASPMTAMRATPPSHIRRMVG
jgi:type IV conjugative transfer system protein TraL